MTLNGQIVPDGWHFAKLGEVADILNGDRGSNYPSKGSFTVSGIRFINAGHLRDGQVSSVDMNFISPNHYDRLGGGKVRLNDVLYCLRGSLGKAAIVKDDSLGAIASSLAIIRPKYSESARYIYYFLVSPLGAKQISEFDNGSAQPNLAAASVKQYELPLAPLAEQTRIADKLDTVLARVDACRDRLARVAPLLKRFRQSVLAAATSGRLTEDWRIASEVLAPWPRVKLSKLGELARGKSKHRPRNDPGLYGGAFPFVQTGDVANADEWIVSHSQAYSDAGLAQSKLWPKGTLCITIAANIADTAILTYPACFPDSVVGFVADENKCLPRFAKWSIDVRKDDLERLAPATAQKNINLGVLQEVEIELPSLSEQIEIVRRVESLFAFADRLDARLTQARSAADRLTPALLAKAFRGELVPQDPEDEPAAELLKRLAAGSQHKATRRRRGTDTASAESAAPVSTPL